MWTNTRRMGRVALLAGASFSATAGDIVSINSYEAVADQFSSVTSISGDASRVLFESTATNLATTDDKKLLDIFMNDRNSGATQLINLGDNGASANADSSDAQISANGRYVVFQSAASNLVAGDYNNATDIYLRDLQDGSVSRINLSNWSEEANSYSYNPSISEDGRFVAFSSMASNLVENDNNAALDVFLLDRDSSTLTLISRTPAGAVAASDSFTPTISADGSTVAFVSVAPDLVDGDRNGVADVFVYSRDTGRIQRVSINSEGVEANGASARYSRVALSADGNVVAFHSMASNLAANDHNNLSDVFVHHRLSGQTTLVSRNAAGHSGNGASTEPALSADGRFLAWLTRAGDLYSGHLAQPAASIPASLLVSDLQSGSLARVSDDYGYYYTPMLSSDGSQVAYSYGQLSLSDGQQVVNKQAMLATVSFNRNTLARDDLSLTLQTLRSYSDGSSDYRATLNNAGAAIDSTLTLTVSFAGIDEFGTTDERCQVDATAATLSCTLEQLPAGESSIEFNLVKAANLSFRATLSSDSAVLSATDSNSITSGGGAVGLLSLLPLFVRRRHH